MTEENRTLLGNLKHYIDNLYSEKVVKIPGKLLSTNDFTDLYKELLDKLDEYKDAFCLGTTNINGPFNNISKDGYNMETFNFPTKQYPIYYVTILHDTSNCKIYFKYYDIFEAGGEIIYLWYSIIGIHICWLYTTNFELGLTTPSIRITLLSDYMLNGFNSDHLNKNVLPGDMDIFNFINIELPELFNTKVDKEEGKGLSSNDFTNSYKDKLDSLEQVELPDNLVSTVTPNVNNIWVGTEEEYNAIAEKDSKILYFIK